MEKNPCWMRTEPWPPQVWMGVTVERADYRRRADVRRAVPAAVRHISAEPLLGPLDELDLSGIHLVVAGGESGPERRPPQVEWLRALRDRCVAQGVRFTFKGWGGGTQRAGGRLLDGREWQQSPAIVAAGDMEDEAPSQGAQEALF